MKVSKGYTRQNISSQTRIQSVQGRDPSTTLAKKKKVYETEPKFLDSYTSHAGAEPKSQAQAMPNKSIQDRTQVLRLVMQ